MRLTIRIQLILNDKVFQNLGQAYALADEKLLRKGGKLWIVWLQNWYLPLMPINFVLIQKDNRITMKNLKLTHYKALLLKPLFQATDGSMASKPS